MSEKTLSIFCQVGFPEKKNADNVYFHKVEGSDYGGHMAMEDGDELLSPFTVEDLLTARIDYDLLPTELQELIGLVAQKTYDAIERMDPARLRRLNPGAIEVKFSLMEDEEDGVENEGKVMN